MKSELVGLARAKVQVESTREHHENHREVDQIIPEIPRDLLDHEHELGPAEAQILQIPAEANPHQYSGDDGEVGAQVSPRHRRAGKCGPRAADCRSVDDVPVVVAPRSRQPEEGERVVDDGDDDDFGEPAPLILHNSQQEGTCPTDTPTDTGALAKFLDFSHEVLRGCRSVRR